MRTTWNSSGDLFDNEDVDCAHVRDALSARADGEETATSNSPMAVDDHVRECPSCRSFQEALVPAPVVARLAPVVDVGRRRPEPSGSDLADRVAAEAARIDREGVWRVLRVALFLVGGAEVAFALPDLLGAHTGHHEHDVRHLGAFGVAFGIGLLVVASRPAKARAFVPLTAALAVAMVGGAIADVLRDETPALGELDHVLELAGLLLVWLLATRRGWHAPPPATGPDVAPADAAAWRAGGRTRT